MGSAAHETSFFKTKYKSTLQLADHDKFLSALKYTALFWICFFETHLSDNTINEAKMDKPLILTNIPASICETWRKNVKVIDGAQESHTTDPHIQKRSRWNELAMAWELFRMRPEVDCFVTGGNLTGQIFALLNS